MTLPTQLPSCSVLHLFRSRNAISVRCAAWRHWILRASLSQRCFSSDGLQQSKWSLHNDFSKRFSNASSQTMINSLCEAKFLGEGSFRLQKLWCHHFTDRRSSLHAYLISRNFSSASYTEAVNQAGVIDTPDDGNQPGQSELKIGPSTFEKSVKGTTDGSSDPQKRSSLYVPRLARHKYASVLIPHLNFDKTLTDVESLANNLQKRDGYEAFTVDKLNALKDGWKQFTILKSELEEIEDKKFVVEKQWREFIVKMKSTGSELQGEEKESFDRLRIDLNTMRTKVRTMTAKLNDLEQTVIPDLLQLPNTIHKATPCLEDKVLFSLYDPPEFDFPAKSHSELGSLNQTLELSDVAPGAFYLLGDLAKAELALQDLLKDQLMTQFGYLQHANPDFGKGVTVEGCGYDIHNPSEVLRLIAHSADGESKDFLTGGSSLPSFAGYFAKKAVTKTKKFLPQKLFTIARLYTPRKISSSQETCASISMLQDSSTSSPDQEERQLRRGINDSPAISSICGEHRRGEDRGILSSMQSTSVSAFVADTKESNSEENMVNELLAVSTAVYGKLGLHFRIVQRNAKALKPFEKAAYSIELATTTFQSLQISSPNSHSSPNHSSLESNQDLADHPKRSKNGCSASPTYVEIGRISLIGDYVSKRLLMLYDKKDVLGEVALRLRGGSASRHGFLNVMFAEIMNVSKFLAVMMENTQTKEGGYEIPAVLHEYPVMAGYDGDGKER